MARVLSATEFGQEAREKSLTPEQAADVVVLRGFPGTTIKAIDPDNRVLEFCISDESVDRMNDTIAVDGWELEAYQKNPVVLFAHDNWSPPVGRSIATFAQDGRLMSRAQFMPQELYPFSYMLYRMYEQGYMRATSVGFIPKSWRIPAQDEGRGYGVDFLRQELTEYSCVPVPANANALLEARSKGIDTAPMKAWAERAIDELNGAGATLDERRKAYLERIRKEADPSGAKLIVALRDAAVVEPKAAKAGECAEHGAYDGEACPKCADKAAETDAIVAKTVGVIEQAVTLIKGGASNTLVLATLRPREAAEEAKAGRVLSAANETRLREASQLLDDVLAQLELAEDDGAKGLLLREPYVLTVRERGNNDIVLSISEAPAPAAGAETIAIDPDAFARAVAEVVGGEVDAAIRRRMGRVD